MNLMEWANILMRGTAKERIEVVKSTIEAVKIFKKGMVSNEGIEAHKLITSKKVELVGFVPNISYIRATSSDPEDLDVIWDHRFSGPVLLYQLKDSPIMLLVNPNVAYNDSRLLEIDENSELLEIRNLKGIIG
jgi:hypothetical protein